MCVNALEEKLPAGMFSLKFSLSFLMINGLWWDACFYILSCTDQHQATCDQEYAMSLQPKCNPIAHLTAVKHKLKKKPKTLVFTLGHKIFIQLDFLRSFKLWQPLFIQLTKKKKSNLQMLCSIVLLWSNSTMFRFTCSFGTLKKQSERSTTQCDNTALKKKG